PNPADIFHSERFKQVLKELSLHFDRIVIDSPPLVPVTDAAILSRLNDCVIFVLRSMKTPKMMARQGLRSLLDVDAHIAGCVLNDVDMNRGDYNYYDRYYYYKKGYGPAAQEDEEDDVPRRTESVSVRASDSESVNLKVSEFDSEEGARKYLAEKNQTRRDQ
nr:hypothetical protein [Polyangiaceae bacterium]